MSGDDLFEVVAEVFIKRDHRVSQSGLVEDFRDGPSASMGRADDCNGPVIFALDNHLAARLDLFQHVHIAREFSLCDADRRHPTLAHNLS
jgi:hypothetical protein